LETKFERKYGFEIKILCKYIFFRETVYDLFWIKTKIRVSLAAECSGAAAVRFIASFRSLRRVSNLVHTKLFVSWTSCRRVVIKGREAMGWAGWLAAFATAATTAAVHGEELDKVC
jgi:hypothetical protein